MFFQILSFFFSLLTLILTGVMLFTFRKPRRITAFSSLVSVLISLLFPVIFLAITGSRPDLRLALPFFSFGLLLGHLRGVAMKLEFVGDQVVGRHSRIFLLLWGFSLALNQALSLFDSSILMAFGMASLFLSTGTQVGFYGILGVRRMGLLPEELDTGRFQNHTIQRMISLGFGGLLLVFLIESILLSIPALPINTLGAVAAQEPEEEVSFPVPEGDEETQVDESPTNFTPFFSGEEILVWTRPLAGFLAESEHKLYAFSSDGSSVRQVYFQPTSAEDSPAPQFSPDGKLWIINSKRSGEAQQYLMPVDGSREYQLLYQNAPVIIKDWSPDASQILTTSQASGSWDVLITDREGTSWQAVASTTANEVEPRWSPAGNEILYQTDQDGNQEIYLVDQVGGNPVNLTQNPGKDKRASWALNGSRIIFTSNRDGLYSIYHMARDGSDLRMIAQDEKCGYKYILSPDGDHLVYTTDSYYLEAGWDNEIKECLSTTRYITSLTSGDTTPIEINEYGDPDWSPDGSRILYSTPFDEASNTQFLHTIKADGTGQANLTPPSNDLFMQTWSADSTRVAQVETYHPDDQPGVYVLTVTNADGSGRRELAAVPWEPQRVFAFKGFSWP
jgi:Tol biopolymer transport system component